MNILFTLNSSNFGGMEYHVLDLVKGLIAREHSIFVVCPEGKMSTLYEEVGAHVYNKTLRFDFDPFYIGFLVKTLRENKIDVIHSHELKASINSLIAGKIAGIPMRISHTHTPISEWQISNVKKKIDVLVNSFIVNTFATKEIALTESRKAVKMLEGIHEDKLAVISNGIDIAKFFVDSELKKKYKREILLKHALPENAFIFGTVGRLSREKGHDLLLSSFSMFLDRLSQKGQDISNVYLMLVGGGVLEEELKKKADELNISDKVIITGVFAAEDLVKYYSVFDIFVFPSLAEGFGLVLAEAMASELLVLCSDLEVLQEVGGASVVYFETANVTILQQKMFDLFNRFDQFEDLKISARQRVSDLFSMQRFIDKYEQVYSSLQIED